jgi:adenylate cyclase
MRRPRWSSWRRRRATLLLTVGVVATGMGIGASAGHLLQGPELQVIDAHFSVRGPLKAPRDVAVVGIDATTLDQLRIQWPFPRRYDARVIDRLRADGARVIAYDVQFSQPTDNADDQALAYAIYRARNVVLATDLVDAHGQVNILGGDQVLRQLHAGWGDSTVIPDADGIYRRLYYAPQGLESFAIVAAERATGRRVSRASFPGGSVPIDFAGPPGTIPTYSFSQVYAGRIAASAFRGRVVVVGATTPTLQDVHPTAASPGELMPGPELQANAISTILHGFPLRDAPGWLTVILIVLLGMAVPLANLRLRSWRVGLLALALAAAYVVATQLAFNAGLIVTFVYPLMAILLATVGTLGADYLFTAFEHQRVRDSFSRFVPEAVIEDVLARAGEDLRLGGQQCVVTVMFTDLRGFTSASEALPAERVIEIVNYYLDQMTEAIMDAGGTLVSYMGDGIMAVFGAPLSQPDHADRALRAAREMMHVRLPRLNAWIRGRRLSAPFRMGIGLNSGPVMAGNIGSRRRVEYTAIGDTTNTASRLEGMTKGTDHMLFVADSTRELLVEQPDDLLPVGELEVRGRRAKIRVWSIPGPAEPAGAGDAATGAAAAAAVPQA